MTIEQNTTLQSIPILETQPPARDSRLVRAAIKLPNQVITGWRHSDILYHIGKYLGVATTQEDQGFIDQYFCWYNRFQSARIALHAKQILKLPNVLTSEDLWDNDGTPREPGKPYNPSGIMEIRVKEWKMSPKEFQEQRRKQRLEKKQKS